MRRGEGRNNDGLRPSGSFLLVVQYCFEKEGRGERVIELNKTKKRPLRGKQVSERANE